MKTLRKVSTIIFFLILSSSEGFTEAKTFTINVPTDNVLKPAWDWLSGKIGGYSNNEENSGSDGEPLFLSPLIRAGKIKEAQLAAKVGGPMAEIAESYSGYLTVNKPQCNSNLFFWFFPAKAVDPEKAPVLLWLQGGPGSSSLFGLFVEHGPFGVKADMSLNPRESTAWTLTHNIIYVDQPVGTGFSFTEEDECYATNETQVGSDLYDALLQFFRLFPRLSDNDFYVTGESYGGKYVPAITHYIDQANVKATQKINLKGMAIGNGLCDPVDMTDYGDFLYNIGLIDEEDRAYFKKIQAAEVEAVKKGEWKKAFELFDGLLNGDLTGAPSYFTNATGYHYYFNYKLSESPAEFDYFMKFVVMPEIRKGIHVGNLTYHPGTGVEKHLEADVFKSVKPWIEKLLDEKKYKIMIYNGQMDIIVAWPLTESFLKSMTWSGSQAYLDTKRTKWHVDGHLAGYAKEVGLFTQVLIRNAGHMVPYDQPEWAFDLINRFTSGKGFKNE